MSQTALIKDIFEFVLLLFSLCVHESAHAWTASLLGDHTARLEGRITLNPTYHIDPIGTLLVPALIIFGPLFHFVLLSGFVIGWAKPTQVITRNFRKIVRDENLVTLAGPLSNLLLVAIAFAILAGIAIFLPNGHHVVKTSFDSLDPRANLVPQPVALLCSLTIFINLSLFFFNLLPIPPLDGSSILRNMLPYGAVQVYDRIGGGWLSWILMFLVGGFVLSLFMGPTLAMVYAALQHL